MAETEMGGPIIVRQSETDIHRIIRNNIKKELKRQAELKHLCSYNLAVVLFFYEIDHEFWERNYYEIDCKKFENPFVTDEPIDFHGNYDRSLYFPVFTLHEASYFMRKYMDIDIVVYPVLVKGKKEYAADIWVKNRKIKHRKWTYMNYETPEDAFEEAALYILLFKEYDKHQLTAGFIGKRSYCSKTYTMYINNLDTYFHIIPVNYENKEEILEFPNLFTD